MKITGAHDFNDYGVAQRNHLPLYALMDGSARMRSDGLSYAESAAIAGAIVDGGRSHEDIGAINLVPEELRGLDRYEARKRIVEDIDTEYARLQAAGAPIVTPIETEEWGERYFQTTEPNGIVYQLVQWVD